MTVGTAYLVAGYRHTDVGQVPATMPWTKEKCFAEKAAQLVTGHKGLDFELGRGMQVVAGTFDLNINAALIAIAHELAVTRSAFSNVRIFVHASKRANIITYRKKIPSFAVVATDPDDPENVVMMTTLDKLYSPTKPWDYSGPMQSLVAVNPQTLTIPKIWNFLTALRTSGALSFDYHDSHNRRGENPIAFHLPGYLYSRMVSAHTSKLGITRQEEADQIVGLLNREVYLTRDQDFASFVDPAAVSFATHSETSGDIIRLSGLDAEESKKDTQYELKILISCVLQYGESLRWAGLEGIGESRYAIITTNEDIARRLRALTPSEERSDSVQVDWALQNNAAGATLKFERNTARTFVFTFGDVQRLTQAYPEIFNKMRDQPALRIGVFHEREILSRPTGL